MKSRLCGLSIALLLVVLASTSRANQVHVDRISLRVSYVDGSEKIQRANLVADASELDGDSPAAESILVSPTDTLVAQVSCVNDKGEFVEPTQAVLRISDEKSVPPVDTIWPLSPRRNEMRREVSLQFETGVDTSFWREGVQYTVQIILGDSRLKKNVVWTATRDLAFGSSGALPSGAKRGVFDFDLSVRKTVQPEFESALPAPVKEAPLPVVGAFTTLSVIPLLALLVAWSRMGAFAMRLPASPVQLMSLAGFQVCLGGHAAALAMFWLQWNIVTTWKVMGALMIPTLYFGHSTLGAVAQRQYLREKSAMKKSN